MIPADAIDRARQSDILELAKRSTALKRVGHSSPEYYGPCPLCGGKDRFSVNTRAPPEDIIPLLNDYADAIVSAIHRHSGDVLRLIGDGVLGIFSGRGSRLRRVA
jgi:hypothetical protein